MQEFSSLNTILLIWVPLLGVMIMIGMLMEKTVKLLNAILEQQIHS